MALSAAHLRATLPTPRSALVLRACDRSDLSTLAAWPAYPFPYAGFAFSFRDATEDELDAVYANRMREEGRFMLVVDHIERACIGYFALLEIDWRTARVGNLSVRIHPDWRGCGVGTRAMQLLCDWAFDAGLQSILLDVAASNTSAVRCYRKAGFVVKSETWRPAADLADVDLEDDTCSFLGEQVRRSSEGPELRFYVMERRQARR